MSASVADPHGDKAFKEFYQQKIHPLLKSLDAKRQGEAKQAQRRRPWAMLRYALWGLAFLMLASIDVKAGLFLMLASVVVWAIKVCSAAQRAYHARIQDEIFPVVVSFFGESFRYSPARGNPTRVGDLYSLKLLPEYDSHQLGDYVCGIYKNVSIEFTELSLTVRKDKKDVAVFEGALLTLGMNRTLNSRILIRQDQGAIGNFFQIAPMPRVQLEDPKFEKMFEVYGTDQLESRVVLTPRFMECVRSLSDRFGGKMECTLVDDKLIALLPTTRDFFAIGADPDKTAVLKDEINGIRNDMKLIFELVDQLQLGEQVQL
jgi:hypothetical protein